MDLIETSPWDRRKEIGFLSAFFQTLKLSLLDPQRFFTSLPAQGGYESPIYFGIICNILGGIFNALYLILFQGLIFSVLIHFIPVALPPLPDLAAGAGFHVMLTVMGIFAIPISAFIDLFIQSAIYQLFLWIVGGNQNGFEATFRVYSFSQGTRIIKIIPFFGSMIARIWQYVLLVIGFKKLHGASTTQALLTVFLPVFIIFFLILLFGILLIAILLSLKSATLGSV